MRKDILHESMIGNILLFELLALYESVWVNFAAGPKIRDTLQIRDLNNSTAKPASYSWERGLCSFIFVSSGYWFQRKWDATAPARFTCREEILPVVIKRPTRIHLEAAICIYRRRRKSFTKQVHLHLDPICKRRGDESLTEIPQMPRLETGLIFN